MRHRVLRRGTVAAQKFIFTGAPVIAPSTQLPPVVVANTADLLQVSSSGATLGGTVNPNGAATTYQIEWGLTTSYGGMESGSVGSGIAPIAVSFAVGGALPSTTYHWRISATNSGGTSRTLDQTFTTQAAPGPTGAYVTVILSEPGLVAYYRLDETALVSPPPPPPVSPPPVSPPPGSPPPVSPPPPPSPPPASVPTNATLPTISGTVSRGQMLMANNGAWNNTPTSFTYQWQRNLGGVWSSIANATQQFYTLAKSDNSVQIRVLVTAANSAGQATATSTATAASVDAPPVLGISVWSPSSSSLATWASRDVNCAVWQGSGTIVNGWNAGYRDALVAADMYIVKWGYNINGGTPVASNTNGIAADASDSRVLGWYLPDENELGTVTGSFTGTISQGSTSITAVSSTSGLSNGNFLAAVGIPHGAAISNISGSTITMNQAANIPAGQPTSNVTIVATGTDRTGYYSVSQVVYLYNLYKAASSTKPVYINLAGGYNEIGPNRTVNYPSRIAAADAVGADLYPLNGDGGATSIDLATSNPTRIGAEIDQLVAWTAKPKFTWIEAVQFAGTGPTCQQTRGEAWDAIIHGANGINWWTVNVGVTPNVFDATTANMQAELTANNALLTKYGRIFQTTPTRLTTAQAPVPFEGSTWAYLGHTFKVVLNMHSANSTWTDGSSFQPWEVRIYMDDALQDSRSAQLGF